MDNIKSVMSRIRRKLRLQLTNAAAGILFAIKLCLFAGLAALSGCSDESIKSSDQSQLLSPSAHTVEANRWYRDNLPLENQQDYIDARRGLVAIMPDNNVENKPLWFDDLEAYGRDNAPDTVNPSLWRQAKLNAISGLFKVAEGVYQLRGFDLANTTLIRGQTGWIIVDPLTSIESTAAAIALAQRHLGEIIPTAIVITHSHIDHFGGIDAWMRIGQPTDVDIIAPFGFLREATSENIMTGAAMTRRASYMFGFGLETGATGHVDSGLGRQVAQGQTSIMHPTIVIDRAEQPLLIDGVEFVFYNMPNSEAPAELTFYLPETKLFCGAELVSHTLHNVLTLRGAKVRDALVWSQYIGSSIDRLADVEILVNSHHWPTWGHRRIVEQLQQQQDVYRFIHDQTLRLANQGYTPIEISEKLRLPDSLANQFHVRGYYGTLSHNSKAVYQHYFGWYDGNPVNLNPLPPETTARRYVTLMGGVESTLLAAEAAFQQGDYRWAAELLNHLVFNDSDNYVAANLLAKSYSQLAYQAESGPWRDIYLSAAKELQLGNHYRPRDISLARKFLEKVPLEEFIKTIAVTLDPLKAADKSYVLNVNFSDKKQKFVLWLRNSVLHYRKNYSDKNADASIAITHSLFIDLMLGSADLNALLLSDELSVDGNRIVLLDFLSMLDGGNESFNIVTP